MTDDIGEGLDYSFSYNVEETLELGGNEYVQKAYCERSDDWSLLLRETGRYGEPSELVYGVENEADVDQLLVGVEESGIGFLLEPNEEVDN